jgi:hypothetical protein
MWVEWGAAPADMHPSEILLYGVVGKAPSSHLTHSNNKNNVSTTIIINNSYYYYR